MHVLLEDGFAPFLVICRQEGWRLFTLSSGHLPERDAAYFLANPHGICYIVHDVDGLVSASFALKDRDTLHISSTQKILPSGRRNAYRLHADGGIVLQDTMARLHDLSAGGCCLDFPGARQGMARLLIWRLPAGEVVETIAVCVHHERDNRSGWRFLAWRRHEERLFRLSEREPVPPLASCIQRHVAREHAVMPKRIR